MGALRKLKRNLNEKSVWIAQEMQSKQVELAKKFVEERVRQDAEFARDVLKAVGDNLPADIKKAAEETIAREQDITEKIEEIKQEYGTVLEAKNPNKDIALDDPPVWALKS